MIEVIVGSLGVVALAMIFFHEHMKDVAVQKLQKQKVTDQASLTALQAQATTIPEQAAASQANATEADKAEFWKQELQDK
jgi:hypothetical protein